jgi:short-subunit dehydrogenase
MGLPAPAADRIAVVTGGSSGIGRAIAGELARRGHGVALIARSADRLAAVADELRALGVRAEAVPADLSVRDERAALPDRIAALGVEVHVLVNNAGFTTIGPVHKARVARELDLIEVDVAAVADLCTRFVPGMVSRQRGAVLNVASTAGFQPLPGQASYAAAKAFVLTYTQALAAELRGTGVTATVLAPGPVRTGFEGAAGMPRGAAEKVLPDLLWVDVQAVARAGVDALARGRLVAVPGVANRVGSVLAALTPRSLLLPVLRRGHPGLH